MISVTEYGKIHFRKQKTGSTLQVNFTLYFPLFAPHTSLVKSMQFPSFPLLLHIHINLSLMPTARSVRLLHRYCIVVLLELFWDFVHTKENLQRFQNFELASHILAKIYSWLMCKQIKKQFINKLRHRLLDFEIEL